jgi:hypothetical protein
MPRHQPITRTRDLLREQDRITIFLACNHVVSVTARQVAMMRPVEVIEGIFRAETYLCPYCPDPEPEPVKREEMSPRQLWRDAGEPIP